MDILGDGPRVTLAPGRYSTADPAIQRKLVNYPGIRLTLMESETPVATAGGSTGPVPALPSGVTTGGATIGSRLLVKDEVKAERKAARMSMAEALHVIRGQLRTPRAILGVAESASWDEVKSAYHRRALECHPDRSAITGRGRRHLRLPEADRGVLEIEFGKVVGDDE